MNKIFVAIALIISIFLPIKSLASQNQVNLYFFRGEGCPHCAKEEPFLKELETKYSNLKVYDYEVWYNADNRKKFVEATKAIGATANGVPLTIVGDKYVVGFSEVETTGSEIEQLIINCSTNICADPAAAVLGVNNDDKPIEKVEVNKPPEPVEQKKPDEQEKTIPVTSDKKIVNVPFVGGVDLKTMSLPTLSIVLGTLDGFNPCAMWVLVFLIGLLMSMGNHKRLVLLGGAFLFAEAAVYFLFMAAFLNVATFLGAIVWVRALIGVVALYAGFRSLHEYWTNPEGNCKVTAAPERKKMFDKMKDAVSKNSWWLALGGILVLAGAVNLVELMCSTGFPVVFTQILVMNKLAWWQYYGYIFIYMVFYMIDDFVIYGLAVFGAKKLGGFGSGPFAAKYARYSNLISAIILIVLGLLLIFKPEWVLFG